MDTTNCECGRVIKTKGYKRHCKTKFHLSKVAKEVKEVKVEVKEVKVEVKTSLEPNNEDGEAPPLTVGTADRKLIDETVEALTGDKRTPRNNNVFRTIFFFIQENVARYGADANGDNDGGIETIVKFWLDRLPEHITGATENTMVEFKKKAVVVKRTAPKLPTTPVPPLPAVHYAKFGGHPPLPLSPMPIAFLEQHLALIAIQ